MKGFRKLIMLGVLLITLLLVIDTIDAGRKQGKKKELENGKSFNQENPKYSNKNKKTESIKQNKQKNIGSQRTENFEEENLHKSKGSKFEPKKYDVRKNFKFANKDENSKTSKHFQKLKKSQMLEEKSMEKFNSGKPKVKKTKPQQPKPENGEKIFKTVKKTSQKKLIEENENVENILSEEMNRFKNEDTVSIEETVGGNPKKRKYKLVEVVLQEDGQEEEGEEYEAELGLEDQEFEETTGRTRITQNPTSYKNKKLTKRSNNLEEDQFEESLSEDYFNNTEDTVEPEFNEETASEGGVESRYGSPVAEEGSCKRLPEDPNRQGPKKLTLYVIEEEINGQIKKRIVSEEDGVTMCEVADLLKETYGRNIPEE